MIVEDPTPKKKVKTLVRRSAPSSAQIKKKSVTKINNNVEKIDGDIVMKNTKNSSKKRKIDEDNDGNNDGNDHGNNRDGFAKKRKLNNGSEQNGGVITPPKGNILTNGTPPNAHIIPKQNSTSGKKLRIRKKSLTLNDSPVDGFQINNSPPNNPTNNLPDRINLFDNPPDRINLFDNPPNNSPPNNNPPANNYPDRIIQFDNPPNNPPANNHSDRINLFDPPNNHQPANNLPDRINLFDPPYNHQPVNNHSTNNHL